MRLKTKQMALGIFRKIGNAFKTIANKVKSGVQWVTKNVLSQPARLYDKFLAGKIGKVPVIGAFDPMLSRLSKATISASEGNWKDAAKQAWGGGELIKDIGKVGTAIAGAAAAPMTGGASLGAAAAALGGTQVVK